MTGKEKIRENLDNYIKLNFIICENNAWIQMLLTEHMDCTSTLRELQEKLKEVSPEKISTEREDILGHMVNLNKMIEEYAIKKSYKSAATIKRILNFLQLESRFEADRQENLLELYDVLMGMKERGQQFPSVINADEVEKFLTYC